MFKSKWKIKKYKIKNDSLLPKKLSKHMKYYRIKIQKLQAILNKKQKESLVDFSRILQVYPTVF